MDNKINGIRKQNESIYNSLKSKNISDIGELITFTDETPEQQFQLLQQENKRLKSMLPPVPVPEKIPVITQEKVKEVKDDDEKEETFEDPIPKFETITNMEDIKRAFFSGEYDKFEELVKEHNFTLLYGTYKWSSDKDGAPEFVAKNLLKGFVRKFDDFRKYFIICFRCVQETKSPNTYSYPSLWIVNTLDDKLIDKFSDDFTFTKAEDSSNSNTFYKLIRKDESSFDESYVH
jgi:hypothetical protein